MHGSLKVRLRVAAAMVTMTGAVACGSGNGGASGQNPALANVTPVGPALIGLHRVDNRIETAAGDVVRLYGVNRSGTEYKCVTSGGIFDGPSTRSSVLAMANWKINAVRVPLNEDCWLGLNGVSPAFSGEKYQQSIQDYVELLHAFHIVPILVLHWAAPSELLADRLQALPNVDHSPDFWRSVAQTFQDDDGVIFEPYNEPFPDQNRDTAAAWECWRDGCMANLMPKPGTPPATTPPEQYAAAGMQAMVDAIRETGATHLILLGGVQYSNALTQWLQHLPVDPLNNLGAAWHIYDNNPCRSSSCWDGAPAQVAAQYPILATELGQGDCSDTFIRPLMDWLDGKELGYLAWSWNAYGPCQPRSASSEGQPWSLVSDYVSGAPNGPYAQAFHDHLMSVAGAAQ